MPPAGHITPHKIKRLIEGAQSAGKDVCSMRIDGSVIELVFSDKTEAQEEAGLSLDWSRHEKT